MISGNCSILKALFYIIAQCLGATAGAAIIKVNSWQSPTQARFCFDGFLGSPEKLNSFICAFLVCYTRYHLERQLGQYYIEWIPRPIARRYHWGIDYILVGVCCSRCLRWTPYRCQGIRTIGYWSFDHRWPFGCCKFGNGLFSRYNTIWIGDFNVGDFQIQYTGASMNPARSFGPALVQNIWAYHWVIEYTIFNDFRVFNFLICKCSCVIGLLGWTNCWWNLGRSNLPCIVPSAKRWRWNLVLWFLSTKSDQANLQFTHPLIL